MTALGTLTKSTTGSLGVMSRTIIICTALVLIALAAHSTAVSNGFVEFDDPEYIRDNALVRRGLTIEGIRWAFETRYIANWHPMTWLSLMLDAHVWGPGARTLHATNVALHAFNVLLLFAVLRSMTGAAWRSALAAALFAVHPLHVESVAWISGRKDVLSTMFLLLCLWAYAAFARRGGPWRYALVAILLGLGLMAKAMLVTLPCILLLLDYWPLRRFWVLDSRSWIDNGSNSRVAAANDNPKSKIQNPESPWELVVEKLPLLAIALCVAAMTYWAQLGPGKPQEGPWLPLGDRLANAVVSYGRYVGKLFWPANLAALYPHPGLLSRAWPVPLVVGSASLLTAITIAAIVLARRAPYFIVGWLWFLGAMLPVIGLVQIGRQSMADRYTYVPMIGLYVIVAWSAGAIVERWRPLKIPVVIVFMAGIAALAIPTRCQVAVWKDSITLFSHAIAVTDDNWLMHNNLGGMLAQAGRAEDGLREVDTALSIAPHAGWVHDHRGTILFEMNRLYEAQEAFERAVEIDPEHAQARYNLGIVLARRDRIPEAIAALRETVRIDPRHAQAHANLALMLASQNQSVEALSHLEQALKLDASLQDQYGSLLQRLRSESSRR
jgi:Tfp pilus assembly protein PilF